MSTTKGRKKTQYNSLESIVSRLSEMEGNKTSKHQCKAARLIPTQQSAVELIMKGTNVYLMPYNNGGKTKNKAYCQCSRKSYENSTFCWKHSTCENKILFSKDIVNNKECKKASLSDFKKANKKNMKTMLSNSSSERLLLNKNILRITLTTDLIQKIISIRDELTETSDITVVKKIIKIYKLHQMMMSILITLQIILIIMMMIMMIIKFVMLY